MLNYCIRNILNILHQSGTVNIRAVKQVCVNDVLSVTLSAANHPNVAHGFFSTPDPLLTISTSKKILS